MNSFRKSCRRWNESGHAHSLTFSCFRRQVFLSSDRSRQWMIDSIDQARSKHDFHLWAYVIRPEHVHMLIWPMEQEYSISKILSTLKQSVSKRALVFLKQNAPEYLTRLEDIQPNGTRHHRFWQRGGGYDRNVTEPSTILKTIEYLHNNPVRRELCRQASEWPWSSAREWESPGAGLLRLDRESLPTM
ncbi:transposase [bacterium]|nr:transposase [bacterium]